MQRNSRMLHPFHLLLGAGVVLMLSACAGQGGSAGEWPDYYAVEDLVKDSEMVIVGILIDQRSEVVELPSPTTSSSGVFREDTIRTYQVDEVLKGGSAKEIEVWSSDAIQDRSAGGRSQRLDNFKPTLGRQYVLFLRTYDREGESIWGRTGEPEAAVLQDGYLTFLASTRYEGEAQERGVSVPETSLNDLREIGARLED